MDSDYAVKYAIGWSLKRGRALDSVHRLQTHASPEIGGTSPSVAHIGV